jgi:succinate dehydrogenase/fumarate reductase flavoprotein subunit
VDIWTTDRLAAFRCPERFYARGQTGQQLLLGAYQALIRQVAAGSVKLFPRHELLDLVVIEGKASPL